MQTDTTLLIFAPGNNFMTNIFTWESSISFPELRSPWPAVRKREPWEQPFQACAIAWNRCRLRLRSELDNQNSVISHCYFKMDAPKALVFRPLVKGNEALGTRLESHIPPLLLPDPPLRPRHLLVHKITFIQYLENLIFQGLWPPCFLPASDP